MVLKNYKPVSRILFSSVDRKNSYHLSGPQIAVEIYLPTLQPAPDSGTTGEQPVKVGIHGISACKVYPPKQLLAPAVSSYLTFSPLSALRRKVIFCGTVCSPGIYPGDPAVNRCIALCCPDFPSHYENGTIARFVINYKNRRHFAICRVPFYGLPFWLLV